MPSRRVVAAVAVTVASTACAWRAAPRAPAPRAAIRRAPPAAARPAPRPTPRIRLADVAADVKPGLAMPRAHAFSPDDRFVTYLASPDASLHQVLYAHDTESGEHRVVAEPPGAGNTDDNLALAEQLRRERQRRRTRGISHYRWAEHGDRLLVPLVGDLYVLDGVAGDGVAGAAALRLLVDAQDAPALAARLSRDGRHVAYVQDAELHVVPSDGSAPPLRITSGARGTGRTNGLAEFVAQEEMDRDEGFWWSHDGSRLAFVEVDETHIPIYRIVHQGKDEVGDGAQEDHRYPFAGAANARVRLGVVAATGGAPVWMDLGDDPDIYLARVAWLPDGRLTAQIQNRPQTELELVAFDPTSGRRTTLLGERSEVWINLHHMLEPLERSAGARASAFVWASERTGFRHLYLHGRDGRELAALTAGPWMVDEIVAVDEDRRRVLFLASRDGPLERHLYEVGLDGTDAPRRITRAPGWHTVVVDHARRRFVDRHGAIDRPIAITLNALDDGRVLDTLYAERDPRIDRLGLEPPRLVTVRSRDGATLHGALYEPPGRGPWRTMVAVYGGPHGQTVKNAWGMTADLVAQYLRERGVLVFKLDNRGSWRRGLAFEGAIKHDMGNLEIRDQVDGVRWLVAEGLAVPRRVGIYGGSYGGYVAAMALARAPDTFALAIARAPVTHWDGYDTHYTERYMGTPSSNPDGYRRSSVMHHVDGIRGTLVLVHGLLDENVHFRHTARLVDALIQARKPHQLLLLPNARHGPRRLEDRVFLEEQILAVVDDRL